jgi:hypothetical protein
VADLGHEFKNKSKYQREKRQEFRRSILQNPKALFSVCGGHFISMNFPPRNWEGYYANSSRVGGKLYLIIGVKTIPLLRGRHKNPPTYKPCDLHRFGS